MARWKTHNRRADKKRRMPYARFRRLRKSARFGLMYGMGAQKLAEAFEKVGITAREATRQLDDFRAGLFGYAIRGNPLIPVTLPQGELVVPDYAALELRALASHQQQLREARDRGDTVIEHNAYDATILVKGEE